MRRVLSEAAERELHEAATYYDECQPHLGEELLDEFEAAVQRILQFPEAWPTLGLDKRQILLRRFPYHIVYSVTEDSLHKLAVFHTNRKPREW